MSNRNNQHIDSIPFKELAYRALKRITPDQKQTLSPAEERFFASDYTLQKFCQEERMDYVMYMLAKVGISWTFRIEREAFGADMVEFVTQEQNEYPLRRVDAIEATKREGVCVISSRDVMFVSNTVAQNCTSKVYEISEFSRDLQKKGKTLVTLKKWENEVKGSTEAYELFNNIMLEQLNSLEYAMSAMGLGKDDLRILCALYKKRDSAVTLSDLAELIKSKGLKMYLRKNMELLKENGLVATDAKDIKKMWAKSSYFMITAKGIGKIMEYQKYVYERAFGV